MAEAAHTPGPWSVESPMGFELTIMEAGKKSYEWRFIASCQLPEDGEDNDFTEAEVKANARLIAAAPDLLTALEALFADYKQLADSGDAGNWKLEDKPAGKLAIAAIAKSTTGAATP